MESQNIRNLKWCDKMPSDLACLSKTWSRPSKLILLTNVRVFSLFANLIQQSRWPLDFKLQRYRWMKYLLSDNPVFRCFKQSPLSKYSIPSPCSNSCASFFYFQNDKKPYPQISPLLQRPLSALSLWRGYQLMSCTPDTVFPVGERKNPSLPKALFVPLCILPSRAQLSPTPT